MVSILDIIKAFNLLLSKEFKITVDSKDLSEKFERPSFRVDMSKFRYSKQMQFYHEREFEFKIYYFPMSRTNNRIELLETQEKLSVLFVDYIEVMKDQFVYIKEVEFDITDGVLVASFEVETLEEINKIEEEELMEELINRRL